MEHIWIINFTTVVKSMGTENNELLEGIDMAYEKTETGYIVPQHSGVRQMQRKDATRSNFSNNTHVNERNEERSMEASGRLL